MTIRDRPTPSASHRDAQQLLIRRAPQLVRLQCASEVFAESCRLAFDMTGACVIGCHSPPPEQWHRGAQLVYRGAISALPPRALSAMFALHRRVSARRDAITVVRSDCDAALFDGLATAMATPVDVAHVVPLVHRTGRITGELALLSTKDAVLAPTTLDALRELAALTAVALENARKLAYARSGQERLFLFAEATEEALWDWNIDTNLVWWGGGIQRFVGGNEAIRHSPEWWLERVHPEDSERVRSSLDACMAAHGSSWSAEYRLRHADGSWAFVEDRAYFLRDATGRPHRAIGAIRDVTECKKLEADREEARQRAIDANQAKDEFLAMLGHELRNPLSPMLTALQLMRLRGDASREIDVLERQVTHLTRLVEDLLEVHRITRGKIALQCCDMDLADAVTRALELVDPLLEKRRHRLEIRAPRGITVHVDPARMAQVVSNLLSNAAKYSDPGTLIVVEASRADGRARLSIEDRGVGIPPEMLERIFDVFVQERQTLDRAHGGLGLGLAIVKNLVAMHGGTISAKSAGPGQGSTFTVELPIATARSERGPTVAEPTATSGVRERPDACGKRVLIVDDNADAAETMQAALEALGHDVCVAHDAAEALRAFERSAPDVALLDIGLPVIDGYELCARMRRLLGAASRVRILAVTGYGQADDRARSAAAGFDGHFVKPVDLRELARTIDDLTGASASV